MWLFRVTLFAYGNSEGTTPASLTWQMCNTVHKVVKVLLFHHEAGPQVLIQFQTSQEAEDVKKYLQSQVFNIDGNIITFEIQFSKFTDLRVNQNNKFSWDFSDGSYPDLPSQPPELDPTEPKNSFSPEPESSRPSSSRSRQALRTHPLAQSMPLPPSRESRHGEFMDGYSRVQSSRSSVHLQSFEPSSRFSGNYTPRSYSSDGYHHVSVNLSELELETRRPFTVSGHRSTPRCFSQDGRVGGDWSLPLLNRNSEPLSSSRTQLSQDYRSSYRNGSERLDSLFEILQSRRVDRGVSWKIPRSRRQDSWD